jgi:hypothetical protein
MIRKSGNRFSEKVKLKMIKVERADGRKAGAQLVQAKATLSSDLDPNFSELRATMRPPSAR